MSAMANCSHGHHRHPGYLIGSRPHTRQIHMASLLVFLQQTKLWLRIAQADISAYVKRYVQPLLPPLIRRRLGINRFRTFEVHVNSAWELR
ncbi:hypothetical protein Agabi119p4_9107 [Agaricus bisporus var. burnettii]|uniref:Uncharacterized protein n=1 Tax=Agaricus bisporus var. burnettii TaxID=192524 RepID=A0A8H7C6N4_AGABI|nr:hypothetical protein Agabi119p4_9107 [Agaricus bisporus var. burnettii]